MRTARVKGEGASYYHCISRVIERRMLLDDSEKERFRKIMRKVARFAGIEVLTWAAMDNHVHLLVHVTERIELTEDEVLELVRGLYGKVHAGNLAFQLEECRKQRDVEQAERLLHGYRHRMYDLSEYMKMLMQRFTQSYNKRYERRGTLWEDRFRSILVEGNANALVTMAAYIDLNAVRGGLAEDPKDYRFCGYGEAVAGDREARAGTGRIAEMLGRGRGWEEQSAAYRQHLYMQAGAHVKQAAAISREKIAQVLAEGGRLSKAELLRCRVRYFTDGVALGSKAFVEGVFEVYRDQFGIKRKSGARRMKQAALDDLCTMRDLRLDAVTLSAVA
jgi:hypothetical protein